MKKLFAFVFLAICCYTSISAQTLKGRVVEAGTNKPVEFASIGILNREAGTVANEQGYFQFVPKAASTSDTVQISLIGYKNFTTSVQKFESLLAHNNGVISLQPEVRNLQEVVIKPRQTKTLITGNTTDTRTISAGFASNDLGSEVGTVLRYKKKKPGRLENVNFNIAYNSFPDQLLFRVNIYDYQNGRIGESLLTEPLYLETMISSGTLSLDLSEKNIYVSRDCFISLEWIKDFGKQGLMFSAGFFNSDSYSRKISQGKWSKSPAGLGFWATVEHEI